MNKQIHIDYDIIKNLPELLEILHENEVPSNLIWRFVSAYQEQKARKTGVPLFGQFELTPLCNLDCKMCYVHLDHEQLNGVKLMPPEWWRKIMLQAHSLGMMNATLTGGECLTYPGFDNVYMFLRSIGVKVWVKTNGLLLNKERIAFFTKHPPRGITVSLYGSSNEAYYNVAGHRAFDIVYSNLLQLKNTSIPVDIAITPSKYLFGDMEQLLEVVKQLNIPYSMNIMLFSPREETGRTVEDLSNEEYAAIFKMMNAKKLPRTAHRMPTEESDKSRNDPHLGIPCGAGRSCFSVNWNGKMSACDNLNALKVDLLNTSFSDAWKAIHSDALAYLRPAECNNCKYDDICFSCVAYRSNDGKPGHCNLEVCDRTKLFVQEGIYCIPDMITENKAAK